MKKVDFSKLKQRQEGNYDKRILSLLKQFNGVALPLNAISFLTKIPKPRTHKVLKSLEKFGLVEKATITSASFYKVKK